MAVANIAIEVNGQQAANALKQITTASRQLESAVGSTTAKVNSQNAVIGSASNQLKTYTRSTQAATGATKSLTSAILPLLVGLKAIEAAQFVFTKTAELESQTKSLEVLTGSVTKAKAIIQELQQLGAVTPFTSTELIDSAKRLNAFGVEGDKVVETTRRLADVAGATGAELQGLVTAYGQVQAKGRLQGEELLQFQERGIALQEELRKMYGLSGEEFQKALSKGRIGAEAVEVAIKRLTDAGGKYANGAIAQSNTLQGKFSTLTDGVESLARNIGTVLAPTIKNVLNLAIMGINAINALMASGRSAAFSKNLLAAQTKLGAGALGVDPALKDTQNLINQLQGSKQKNLQGARADLQTIADIRKTLQSVRQREMTFNLTKIGRETIGKQFQQLRSLETAANAAVKAAQVKQQPTGSNAIPELLGETGGDKKGRSAADKAARDAARLAEQTQTQLDAAYKLSALAEADLDIQLSMTKEEKLQGEFDKTALERRIKFLDLQKSAKSESERQVLASAQLSEILIANNKYAKDKKDLLEQQTAELYSQLDVSGVLDKTLQNRLSGAFMGNTATGTFGTQMDLMPGLTGGKAGKKIEELKTQISELTNIGNMAITAADGIGAAFADSFQGLIQGSMNAQQALGNFFKSVANMFLEMAAQIIAKQMTMIVLQGILKALGAAVGGGSVGSTATNYGGGAGVSAFNPASFSMGSLVGGKAIGGPVTGNASYMVGERGPEIFTPSTSGNITPNNRLRDVMGGSPASAGGGQMLNMTFETTRFGNTEYVSRDQLEAAMAQTRRQAANDGAKRGMGMTLDKLQQSPQTRSRVGIR